MQPVHPLRSVGMGNTTGALLFIVAGIIVGYLVFTKRIFQSSNPQSTATTPPATPGGSPLGPPSNSIPTLPNYTTPTMPGGGIPGIPSGLLYPR